MRKVKSCTLVGCNGNAFAVTGRWANAARGEGWTEAEIEAVLGRAVNGDYNHMLRVIVQHCEDPAGRTT